MNVLKLKPFFTTFLKHLTKIKKKKKNKIKCFKTFLSQIETVLYNNPIILFTPNLFSCQTFSLFAMSISFIKTNIVDSSVDQKTVLIRSQQWVLKDCFTYELWGSRRGSFSYYTSMQY
ncbi:hypothetical protein WA026_016262 [Henosepilachna vigintioctopunctata]|uniref:Uncharacterized protein n=1 Tax=Henosepilachna vigintioctopunctata TaxID=420089 RepID=A0AAW1UNH0_9CUCU